MIKVPKPTNSYKKLKKLVGECDDLWKMIIFQKDKHCIACLADNTRRRSDDPHHFITKSLSSLLRLDSRNGVGLCRMHHNLITFSADPETIAKIIAVKGQPWADKLYKIRHETPIFPWTIGYLEKRKVELEKELEEVTE